MIFWWGIKTVAKPIAQGKLYCFSCRMLQECVLKQVRNYFALYSFPLIPLSILESYVECKQCESTFETEMYGDDLEVQEIAHSPWDQLRCALGLFCVLSAAAALMVSHFTNQHAAKATETYLVSEQYPGMLIIENRSAVQQQINVAQGKFGQLFKLEPRERITVHVPIEGGVELSIPTNSVTVPIYDPKVASIVVIDEKEALLCTRKPVLETPTLSQFIN